MLESHANHQLDNQVNEINTWIGQKIGGIIVLPLDNNAMLPLIQKAHDNNVKFLDYSDKALPGVDGWVIFNNLQGARLVGTDAGRWVNRTARRQGEGRTAHPRDPEDRHGTASTALSPPSRRSPPRCRSSPGTRACSPRSAYTVTQSMLQAHPDLNVIFCIADDGCLGAERAFMQTHPSKARQATMYIAGWDGTVPVCKKIVSGKRDPVHRRARPPRHRQPPRSTATANAIEGKTPTQINYPYVLVIQSPAGIKRAQDVHQEVRRRYGVSECSNVTRCEASDGRLTGRLRGKARQAASRLAAYQSGGLLVALHRARHRSSPRTATHFLTRANLLVVLLQVSDRRPGRDSGRDARPIRVRRPFRRLGGRARGRVFGQMVRSTTIGSQSASSSRSPPARGWGLMNGVLISYLDFSPIIVTLGGLRRRPRRCRSDHSRPDAVRIRLAVRRLGNGEVFGIPVPAIIFLAAVPRSGPTSGTRCRSGGT